MDKFLRRLQVFFTPEDGGSGGGSLLTGDQPLEGNQEPANNDPAPPANNPDDGKGSLTPRAGWIDGLPADLRDHEIVKDVPKAGDFVKKAIELQEKLSRASAVRPAEDAPAEEWDAYRQVMGIPAKAEDYELPENELIDKAFADAQREQFHKLGLTKEQAKTVYESTLQKITEGAGMLRKANQQAREGAEASLKQEFGDKYQNTLLKAQKALNVFAPKGDDTRSYIDKSGLGNHAGFIKMLASMHDKIGGDSLLGNDNPAPRQMSQAEKDFPNSPEMK